MNVLVLGGAGMLGHALLREWVDVFDLHATFRTLPTKEGPWTELSRDRRHVGVSAENVDSVVDVLSKVRPDVVVNCIGIVKQQSAAKDPIACLTVNALFPHRLAKLCGAAGARFIHVSTDCVFSGKKGRYQETDPADATDLYGLSKYLGEVSGPGCLTLRTSIIGREWGSRQGLIEWFLSQAGGKAKGYKKAIYSGLTTLALARLMATLIHDHSELSGLWHVAADPISKFDLLTIVNEVYQAHVDIEPDETFACDRSLNGERFSQAVGWRAPDWNTLIRAMHDNEAVLI